MNFYSDSAHKVTQNCFGTKINGIHLLNTCYESDNTLEILLQNKTKAKGYTFENVNCILWQGTENYLYAQP